MSISSSTRKAGPYSCNGATVAFPFAFKVFTTADVLVVLTDAEGAESTLSLGANYAVALNADQDVNPGGTVTTVATYATGYKITLTSQVQNLQPVTLTNQGGFYPRVINDALDRLTILTQQIAEQVSRAVKVQISGGGTPDDLVAQITTGANTATNAAAAAAGSAALAAQAVLDCEAAIASVPNLDNVLTAEDFGTGAGQVAEGNHTHSGYEPADSTILKEADIGSLVQAHMDAVSQAEAEAGTGTEPRTWTAERVKQAIAALGGAGPGGGITSIVSQFHGGAAGTFTVTIASPAVFTKSTHRFENGQTVRLSTTGALPTGLSAGVTYFVRDSAASTFRLSATKGGTAINTSGTQSGTHTVTPIFDKAINNPVGVIAEVLGSGGPGATPIASGGEGGYALKWIPAASLGATETITTSASGTSSFGSHVSATSGGAASGGTGGAGGTGTGGDINITGKAGHAGGADYVAPTYSILGGTYGMGANIVVTVGPGIVKITEYI